MADPVAAGLLRAVVEAGGSRHVVSATAVALWRAVRVGGSAGDVCKQDVEDEVSGRVALVEPVLRAKVEAAHMDTPARIDGGMRAARNVAEHGLFGEGVAALPTNAKEAKLKQRGRRRGAQGRASASGSSHGSEGEPHMDALPQKHQQEPDEKSVEEPVAKKKEEMVEGTCGPFGKATRDGQEEVQPGIMQASATHGFEKTTSQTLEEKEAALRRAAEAVVAAEQALAAAQFTAMEAASEQCFAKAAHEATLDYSAS